ncbi:MAG: nucleoside triphosphate pyrophosphohydrolase [Vicinamibacterales bacterium]|jgi:MazG family protein|nr:nucleoside triphosphate pyrophosphohydrolase [Vicinamibacterales bacterium]
MTTPTDADRSAPPPTAGDRFDRLVQIMRRLRSPDGCAWDREQTLASLRPFVLEEAYEVVDAIDRGDRTALCDELGDLLLEAVFVAQICAEASAFTIADATDAVVAKLIRRHPHVFGGSDTETDAGRRDLSPAEVKEQWERIKTRERAGTPERATLLDGIPEALPSLLRASRIGARTANVGFDWDEPGAVIDKVDEELAELRQAVASADPTHIEEELGDLLFTVANLARKLRVDPESALRAANGKFTRRFRAIEQRLAARGRALHDATPEELEREWQAVKALSPEEAGDS